MPNWIQAETLDHQGCEREYINRSNEQRGTSRGRIASRMLKNKTRFGQTGPANQCGPRGDLGLFDSWGAQTSCDTECTQFMTIFDVD